MTQTTNEADLYLKFTSKHEWKLKTTSDGSYQSTNSHILDKHVDENQEVKIHIKNKSSTKTVHVTRGTSTTPIKSIASGDYGHVKAQDPNGDNPKEEIHVTADSDPRFTIKWKK